MPSVLVRPIDSSGRRTAGSRRYTHSPPSFSSILMSSHHGPPTSGRAQTAFSGGPTAPFLHGRSLPP